MLTLRDCVDISDLSEEEAEAVALHEHLPFIVGLEKGQCLVAHSWGDAALRQIAWDNLNAALDHHQTAKAGYLHAVYRHTCRHHPGTIDRRHHVR